MFRHRLDSRWFKIRPHRGQEHWRREQEIVLDAHTGHSRRKATLIIDVWVQPRGSDTVPGNAVTPSLA